MFFYKWKFYRKQKCAISFHPLLPLPKRIQQWLIAWILFVSLFSLFQKNRGTNHLNSFVSPFSLSKRIQRTNYLTILLILPFPLNKRFQRTNRLRYLLFPLTKIQRTNRLRILCLNTLEGTSFVVQVEGTSTWVVETENKRGYISCGSVQVEGTSTWLFKENKGGYIPCGSLLVKDFTRLKEIWRTDGCLGTGCRHRLLLNQYKTLVFVFFFPTLFNFRCALYFYALLLFKLHSLAIKPNWI